MNTSWCGITCLKYNQKRDNMKEKEYSCGCIKIGNRWMLCGMHEQLIIDDDIDDEKQ